VEGGELPMTAARLDPLGHLEARAGGFTATIVRHNGYAANLILRNARGECITLQLDQAGDCTVTNHVTGPGAYQTVVGFTDSFAGEIADALEAAAIVVRAHVDGCRSRAARSLDSEAWMQAASVLHATWSGPEWYPEGGQA